MSAVAWVAIDVGDLNAYGLSAIVEALREQGLAEGQGDPFDDVMPDVVNYVRNRISKKINVSATALTVPPELKKQTILLIIEAMNGRLDGALDLSEDKKTMIRDAKRDLDIAGTDELPISEPLDPVQPDVQTSASRIKVVYSRTRTETGDSMKGL